MRRPFRSRRVRLARSTLRGAAALAFGVAAAAIAVRLSVRDGVHATAPLFYATPPAVIATAAAAAVLVARRAGMRRLSAASAALFVVGAFLSANQWRSAHATAEAATGEAPPLRAVLWNVEHGGPGWDASIAWTLREDPDVVALVEGPRPGTSGFRAWREAFPAHEIHALRSRLVLLVRGHAEVVRETSLGAAGSRAALVRLRVRGRAFSAFVCDVPSSPLLDRGPLLARLRAQAETEAEGCPLLVVGDFNTPRESVHFDAWRPRLRDAFETVGTGWAPTWPMPLPVLELDHVWASAGIDLVRAEHGTSSASDHRAVVVDFDVAPPR